MIRQLGSRRSKSRTIVANKCLLEWPLLFIFCKFKCKWSSLPNLATQSCWIDLPPRLFWKPHVCSNQWCNAYNLLTTNIWTTYSGWEVMLCNRLPVSYRYATKHALHMARLYRWPFLCSEISRNMWDRWDGLTCKDCGDQANLFTVIEPEIVWRIQSNYVGLTPCYCISN